MSTTEQTANRLIELCRKGENMQALNELYAENCISKEMPQMPNSVTEGKEAITKKSEEWLANVEEFHGAQISDAQVAGNHFSCTMDMDVTFKDRGRQQMSEVCVYEVNNDGKIVNEQFFYAMPPQA